MSGGVSAWCGWIPATSCALLRNSLPISARLWRIGSRLRLSQPALEVLAVIAYYQPVTRAYVDRCRGVDSAYTVGLLLERELIEECGRLAVPGRPILYRTTKNFLRSFGLSSLEELPELPDASQESGQLTLELEAAVARLRAEESGQTVQEDGAAHPAQEETE